MSFFTGFTRRKKENKHLEMILDHDGRNWVVSGNSMRITASSLDGLDKKLERALADKLQEEKKLSVFMSFNNEVIPMWIRPYMNHYFNRILELPLQYQ